VSRAYELFAETFNVFRLVKTLPYSGAADALYSEWRSQRIRGGTHESRQFVLSIQQS